MSQDLAAWLKTRRGNLSLDQFEKVTGVSRSSQQRYENGRPVTLAARARYKAALADWPEWAAPSVHVRTQVNNDLPPLDRVMQALQGVPASEALGALNAARKRVHAQMQNHPVESA